jgi:putative FmdB family regulatory protein
VPTYAYRCAACDHAFDVHQSFADEALTVCPECQGPLRKQYGSVGVTFRGSGFYRTDSRGGSSSSASSTTSSSKSTATKTASA